MKCESIPSFHFVLHFVLFCSSFISGVFETVSQRIGMLADSTTGLLKQLLARVEESLKTPAIKEVNKINPLLKMFSETPYQVLALLCAANNGLSETEIIPLIKPNSDG